MKIMLVDDHALFREGLRLVLMQLDAGTEVVEAEDCEQAFRLARQRTDLDLVLLDLSLPDVSGMEALRQFRAEYAGLPVVVLSGRDDRATIIEALDAGAMGFIPKSSTSRVMMSALRLVLANGVYIPPAALLAPGTRPPPARGDNGEPDAPSPALRLPDKALTERQMQVLELLVQGKPTKLICRELGLAEGTAKVHIASVLRALHVANRTQAVVAVSQLGITFRSSRAG
ncbi:Two component transcriptional regulator, LuxR family [Paraburkholderia ribeironis]|uniref:Two component transcriptional regulator, LuxR family n=1 Tax=Paraburkholderia ribeironis TaxID=1247936 RepID=A0A1N7S7G4_9BURK|nr:response regulator transcription factor [Paraburkholderia ribeironis]SIT43269.1 Two component transcriptional regulator, LuxR family [Paraburkholderia ribeironis]